MAGPMVPGGSTENPIPINVTALVDIIFCLCIFFMCTFHFRQLECKIDSWMPQGGTQEQALRVFDPLEGRIEVRLEKRQDALGAPMVARIIGGTMAPSDREFRQVLREIARSNRRDHVPAQTVSILSEPQVPWKDVVNVLDLCRAEEFPKLEFAR
jgi:biopolymer transport protein ExbD